ncbi:DUF418 domain-containing protein [Corynebacterium sp. P3-F1]|uniref:DUF418 domain-containing protein n=1 Tax=Corynebacterium sp. P3-F1 TaxID=3059080 RepID=UPI00265D2022|nr:DUF418 domain-containing protein [Corynebacterium sp. P3-F1]WKK61508.1 DUF418 domain-containing protein [Corynebacterium sp. P3-F1]
MKTRTQQGAGVSKVRYIAPDVARGMALLGIALANVPTNWLASHDAAHSEFFGGTGADPSALDIVLIIFQAMFVHVRGLAMFSMLLGMGIGMIVGSLWRRGYTNRAAKKVVLKRYFFLFCFGLVHLVFFFPGDILTAYGICGMVTALLIGGSDRVLRIVSGVLLGLWCAYCALGALMIFIQGPGAPILSMDMFYGDMQPTYVDQLHHAVGVLGAHAFPTLSILPLVLLGFVWGRERVMQDVDGYAGRLWAWVIVTVLVILFVGFPFGLSSVGVLPYEWEPGFALLNQALGRLTGPGILAAVMLAMRPVQRRINEGAAVPGWLASFNALGKRSMTGYLGQTLILFPLTSVFLLGIGHDFPIAGQMALATGVWLVTLLAAWLMERRGIPGPFEKLHRTMSYGRDGLPQHYELTSHELQQGPDGIKYGYKQKIDGHWQFALPEAEAVRTGSP